MKQRSLIRFWHGPLPMLLLGCTWCAVVQANDGIASVSAGGIVFGKTDAIAMKKEVLSVSADKIVVDYDFVNESSAPRAATISFPLPEYSAAYHSADTYYGQPANFSIAVDGRAVDFKTVIEARRGGEDVTATLKKLGLSDQQIAFFPAFSPFGKTVAPLTLAQQKRLAAAGLWGDSPNGEPDVPGWTVLINYVWQQTFLPHVAVHVRHQYAPFVAAGPGYSSVSAVDNFKRDYCADASFDSAWDRAYTRQEQRGVMAGVAWVSYILKTGNTWKNGIEDFTLNLIKRDPAEVISLCFPGKFVKLNATTLQVKLRNFKPTRDLQIFFGNTGDGPGHPGVMPVIRR